MFPLNPAGFLPDLRRLRLRVLTGVWGDGDGGGTIQWRALLRDSETAPPSLMAFLS